LINHYTSSTQTLIPDAELAFDNKLHFNNQYIKSQKIKSITFDIIDKKDLQVAEDKGILHVYEFNLFGKLTRFFYTNIVKEICTEYYCEPVYRGRKLIKNGFTSVKKSYIHDTTSTTYFYDSNQNLILKRHNDGNYYESYYYDYNLLDKPEKERRFKETNVASNKNDFKLGTQFLISLETFSYVTTGTTQLKKTCMNDEGRPYKDVIYNYNQYGKITSINEQYTVTWINQTSIFTYNSKNQLTSAIYKSNSNGDYELKRTYEYDSNDCLLTEKHYKNNILQKEISYVTDSQKKLTSFIEREADKKSLRIVKLIYEFYK
jgi:hypothetical protein